MAATKLIVIPQPGVGRRGWIVDQPGSTAPIATLETQGEAITRAREELARLGGGEIEIHLRYGGIRQTGRPARKVNSG